jgi:transcriptional regulator with XRE-family HTH domain
MSGETKRLLIAYAARTGVKSQRQLAMALGVTPQSVSLLLKGQRTMSSETALVICEALQIDVGDTLRRLTAERERRSRKVDHGPGDADPLSLRGSPFRRVHQRRLL